MDVNDMTADELRKLADEKSSEPYREIEVDGLTVHVDNVKCKSWEAFKIMASISDKKLNAETISTMVQFVELVTDVDEERIIEHCGGENASFESVLTLIAKIVNECQPKN